MLGLEPSGDLVDNAERDSVILVDINGNDAYVAEMLSEYQVWIIIGKCQLLLSALILASTKMPEYQNWVLDNVGCQLRKNFEHYAIGI